jgi:mono/diheme cytochrome c family protein
VTTKFRCPLSTERRKEQTSLTTDSAPSNDGCALFRAALAGGSLLGAGAALAALHFGSMPTARADELPGKALYTQYCMACHGVSGKGNGPSGKGLNPKPTDFTTAAPDDAEWFKATKLGTKAVGKSTGMEGFGSRLSDQQIKDVLEYAKAFKRP